MSNLSFISFLSSIKEKEVSASDKSGKYEGYEKTAMPFHPEIHR
jgi:hypothetical protein